MLDKSELEKRVVVLETHMDNIKTSISEMKEITFDVKEHLSRQNGILPRLEKTIMAFDGKLDSTELKLDSVSTKVKIIWGIFATIGGALLVSGLSLLLSKI